MMSMRLLFSAKIHIVKRHHVTGLDQSQSSFPSYNYNYISYQFGLCDLGLLVVVVHAFIRNSYSSWCNINSLSAINEDRALNYVDAFDSDT